MKDAAGEVELDFLEGWGEVGGGRGGLHVFVRVDGVMLVCTNVQ